MYQKPLQNNKTHMRYTGDVDGSCGGTIVSDYFPQKQKDLTKNYVQNPPHTSSACCVFASGTY